MVSLNEAVGPYSETEYGNEVGLVYSRALGELSSAGEGDGTREASDHLSDLPVYDLREEHEGVVAAYALVEAARPPAAGCECIKVARAFHSIKARVLYHYPLVAEAAIAALKKYARQPPDARALYHWPMGNDGCVCMPSPVDYRRGAVSRHSTPR
jgi:hypothetical protein